LRTKDSPILSHHYGADLNDAINGQRYAAPHACRVLVVDDDDLARTRLSALLSASQFEVEAAATGAEALRVLDRTHCQVVLTDWQMPDMDGLTLCRHVRLRVQDSYTYVVMLTIRNTQDDMLTGFAAGADDYVVKGATISEILARVEIGRRISRRDNALRITNRENSHLSYSDPVSGAYNIAYLVQHLPRELARSQRHGHALAVLHCDIDGFRKINDHFGYEVGDALLRAFVTRTGSCIRNGDWLARTGDDEFMLILPETSAKGAHRVAHKLQQQFALHPLATPAGPIAFTASIEVTAIDAKRDFDSTLQIHALLRTVDRRMVAHKSSNERIANADSEAGAPETGGKNEIN
jgi:diguanylate cyclase (GGDEF)-like protein